MGKKGSILLAMLVVCVPPMVLADDVTPIPEAKPEVEKWFKANVGPLASRKDLDPALVAAETGAPRLIKVDPKGGKFKTLTDALKSVPANNKKRMIIKMAPGEYKEKVTIEKKKPFITLMGDPRNMPIITFGGTVGTHGGTLNSAFLIIFSDF